MLTPGIVRSDAGSVLMLMPAALLTVLVLAAITVDLSVVHLARNDLLDAASAAANDATTFGLSEDALRRDGTLVLDPERVEAAVHDALATRGLLHRLAGPPDVLMASDGAISVRLVRRVDLVFARALPGDRSATVSATSVASTLRR